MKKTRFLAAVLCIAMLISNISVSVMAVSFDDVEKDPTVSWAKQFINKMTEAGYIKGYEDGTFRPYRAITKIECLILMSRMLGFEDDAYSDFVDAAVDAYKATAIKYNSSYANELSYLLYCGVLQEKDLVDYASAANANTQLLRYQAAMLMAKLMGADEAARSFSVSSPTYADNLEIPANARPYVEYVTENQIMNGMDATESGDPQFSPTTSLTRAQMATLLARMMDKLDAAYIEGTVDEVNNGYIVVDKEEYDITSGTKVYSDGKELSKSDLEDGADVVVLSVCGTALVIITEASQEVTDVVYGVVVRKNESADGRKITVADYEDEDTNETYTLANNCVITVDDSKANFGDIMADDFVKLELSKSRVVSISTADTSFDVTGVLVSTEYDDDDHVYLNVGDKNGENVQTYVVSIKGYVVSRDGDKAEIRELSEGDSVKLRLTYGKVTRITATSSSETFSGLLTEIIISSSPSITVSSDGKSKTYKLRRDAKITIAGKTSTIYDLRPNITITGVLDSNQVRSISASTVSVSETGEISGVITGKNTSYSVLTVEDDSGNVNSVYYNSDTTFLNSSGSKINVKSIENGSRVSVTGAENNGVFEATIVIVR